MLKFKKLDLGGLNHLKNIARKIGNLTKENFAQAWKDFVKENNLSLVGEIGHVWEIAVFFVLGVMQANTKKTLFVYADKELDKIGIDLEINRNPVQLKFGWDDSAAESLKDKYGKVVVINAPMPDGCGIDVFRNMLEIAGFSEKEIEVEIDENPGFDAAEEVYEWFKKDWILSHR